MNKKCYVPGDLTHFAAVNLSRCLTILRSIFFASISAVLFLSSCGQGNTNNYYEVGKAGVSGGGATKDPGDGTGGTTGDGGGGGQGIKCGETDDASLRNQIIVRDIYEAVSNHKMKMKSVSLIQNNQDTVSSEAIKVLVNSIKAYYGPASDNLDFATEKFWEDFAKRISFIDSNKQLFPSKDANSPIALPKNCEVVQIAYWDDLAGDAGGTLYVSKTLWKALDQFNKVALMAHEFFFKQARKAKYRNSDALRFKVGQLLSQNGLEPLFKDWSPAKEKSIQGILPSSRNGFKFCEGTTQKDPTAKIQFYEYEDANKRQRLVFPIIYSKTINTSFLQSNNFLVPMDASESQNGWGNQEVNYNSTSKVFKLGTDLLIYQSDFRGTSTTDFTRHHPLLSWWYERDGFLSGLNFSFPKIFKELKANQNLSEYFWQDSVETPTSQISLALINPLYNPVTLRETLPSLKSKESLVQTVFEKIKNTVLQCKNISLPRRVFSGAIAQLNSEIETAIKDGEYPKKFINWTSTLKEFESHVGTKDELGDKYIDGVDVEKYCKFSLDEMLTTTFPYILYNLKLNTLSTQDIYDELGEDSLTPATPDMHELGSEKIALGKIKVSQDQSDLTFDLRCEDYSDIHLKKLNQSRIFEKVKEGNVDTAMHIPSRNDHLPLTATFGDLKNTGTENSQTTTDSLIDLGEYFTKNERHYRSGLIKAVYFCVKAFVNTSFMHPCGDVLLLGRDLEHESTIKIITCQSADFSDSMPNLKCGIVKMGKSKNSYLIRYSNDVDWSGSTDMPAYEKEDTVRIFHVQRVPIE